MKFHQNSTSTLANSGTAGTSGSFSAPNPIFSPNAPFGGGAYAIDFGNTAGTSAVDLLTGEVLNAAKDLKSFTLMGWLNCRSAAVSPGGNRIVSWYQPLNSGDGVDLAMNSAGALSLGVKSWNDISGATSNGGKITVDASTGYNNWRFFAVTYDGTLAAAQVKFYFGTSTSPAELDRTATYNMGPTGANIAPSLTIGNHSTATRSASTHAVFRGMMDEIRVFGSKTNGSGALSLSVIQNLQGAAPLAGQPGLLFERWNNIPGTTLTSLTSNSRFPNNPDQTLVRAAFEGAANSGDNYGVRMSGWIEAPETGTYVFGFTSDDAGELRLSTDANPVNKVSIITNPTWTPVDAWSKVSAPIALEEGKFYYIEALEKEGTGGDHLRVGWQRPSDTDIQLIVAPALFVTPPQTDVLYPSAYHLYEQGTGTRKATMGWHKETGNNHFYIEAEGHRSLKVQNGNLVVPDRLFFGGKFLTNDPNQNDLGFRWDRPTVGDIGTLHLETQGGRWALRVQSGSEVEPNVEFNRQFTLTGPGETLSSGNNWAGFASDHYLYGSYREREQVGLPTGHVYKEWAQQNAAGLNLYKQDLSYGFTQAETTLVAAGRVEVRGKDPYGTSVGTTSLTRYGLFHEVVDSGQVKSRSVLNGDGLTTDGDVYSREVHATTLHADSLFAAKFVTTPKWKIASALPDYVFEKTYKLRSLEETERFVREKKHLPEIPSAKEMSEKGLDLADMNIQLLKKVEELTLHMIALDKELKAQRRDNRQLTQEVRALRGAGKGN